jgi:eukaryotic-like serine/threonine-protein kinase
VTEEGLPYLVMEYVEGERIDSWCDSRKLPLRDRLILFRSVCAAVQHAHDNQVVHRDLKPGNILVTAEGIPNCWILESPRC